MRIEPQKPKNKYLEKVNKDFMKDSYQQEAAEALFRERIQNFKAQGKRLCKESVVKYAERHGFLKTETDKKIVESIIRKEKIKEDPDGYRESLRKKAEQQKIIRSFMLPTIK